jgi:hypothetical protein
MEKQQQAEKIIKEHVLWSLGAGLIPIPLVDVAAVTVVQLDMSSNCVGCMKKFILTLRGSLVIGVDRRHAGSNWRQCTESHPWYWQPAWRRLNDYLSGASTYAVGRVAILHFTSGGGLLDLDFNLPKRCMQKNLKKEKTYASNLEKENRPRLHRLMILLSNWKNLRN